MKIKLNNTVKCASTGITFHAGKIYNATIASNQPKYARLTKTGIKINKVFVEKGGAKNPQSLLVENNDFEIQDFPEYDQAIETYKNSKVKIKKQKKLVPDGYKLRDGFRPFKDIKEQTDKLFHCDMGKANGEKCGKETVFVKEIRKGLKVARCLKCAAIKL